MSDEPIEVEVVVTCYCTVEVVPNATSAEERDAQLRQAAQNLLGRLGVTVESAEIV
jgi:hypothetical protein